jgi:hypothetical protein
MLLPRRAAPCGTWHPQPRRPTPQPIAAAPADARLQLSVDKRKFCSLKMYSGVDVNLSVWRIYRRGERHHDPSPGWPAASPALPNAHAYPRDRLYAAPTRTFGKEVRPRSFRSDPRLCADCGRRSTPRQTLALDGQSHASLHVHSKPPRSTTRAQRGLWPLSRDCQLGQRPRSRSRAVGRCQNATPASAAPVVPPSQA